jgi:hypothetical protein
MRRFAPVTQARRLGLQATFLGTDSWNLVSMQAVPEADGAVHDRPVARPYRDAESDTS